jgi:hypothetical protein
MSCVCLHFFFFAVHANLTTEYRAARVHVIFELPLRIRQLYPHKLLYIELFTHFTPPSSTSSSGFYRTSPALRNGKRAVAVVPLSAIRMCCQLAPVFSSLGPQQRLTGGADLLDVCQQFSFNLYADYFLFEVMQHWQRWVNAGARP